MTLIELLVVLSIIGILAAVVTPRMRTALASQRMRGATTSMSGLVASARAAAVQHGGLARFRIESGKAWAESGPTSSSVVIADTVKFDSQFSVGVTPTTAQINFGGRGLAIAGPTSGLAIVLSGESGRRDTLCVTTLGALLRRACGA